MHVYYMHLSSYEIKKVIEEETGHKVGIGNIDVIALNAEPGDGHDEVASWHDANHALLNDKTGAKDVAEANEMFIIGTPHLIVKAVLEGEVDPPNAVKAELHLKLANLREMMRNCNLDSDDREEFLAMISDLHKLSNKVSN